jgi:hypothetical protein
MHTTGPLEPDPSRLEVETAIADLKSINRHLVIYMLLRQETGNYIINVGRHQLNLYCYQTLHMLYTSIQPVARISRRCNHSIQIFKTMTTKMVASFNGFARYTKTCTNINRMHRLL